MSVIAAALRELIAAGVTGDALVTAVERIEEAALPKRTTHALRQQRYRERHKASQSVTRDDLHVCSSSISESENKKRKKHTSLLSPDASLSDADRDFARSQGWSDQRSDSEFLRFRDHAHANNRRQADWAAAWRNWVRSPYQQKANGHGARNGVMEALDVAIDRAGGGEVQGNHTMVDVTPRRG